MKSFLLVLLLLLFHRVFFLSLSFFRFPLYTTLLSILSWSIISSPLLSYYFCLSLLSTFVF